MNVGGPGDATAGLPWIPMAEDVARLILDVYDTREGWSSPDHGVVEIPAGWEFLASGDAFLTRTVKAGGVYWTAWLPRSRHRPRRRLLGLWAPKPTLDEARVKAAERDAARAAARQAGDRRNRERREQQYREDLGRAIVEFLAFAPEHADLAAQIAREASAHAPVVGATRAGLPRRLTLEERAALAARATIRHRYTDHDDTLGALTVSDFWDDEALFREARTKAHTDVDGFLLDHRRPQGPPAS